LKQKINIKFDFKLRLFLKLIINIFDSSSSSMDLFLDTAKNNFKASIICFLTSLIDTKFYKWPPGITPSTSNINMKLVELVYITLEYLDRYPHEQEDENRDSKPFISKLRQFYTKVFELNTKTNFNDLMEKYQGINEKYSKLFETANLVMSDDQLERKFKESDNPVIRSIIQFRSLKNVIQCGDILRQTLKGSINNFNKHNTEIDEENDIDDLENQLFCAKLEDFIRIYESFQSKMENTEFMKCSERNNTDKFLYEIQKHSKLIVLKSVNIILSLLPEPSKSKMISQESIGDIQNIISNLENISKMADGKIQILQNVVEMFSVNK